MSKLDLRSDLWLEEAYISNCELLERTMGFAGSEDFNEVEATEISEWIDEIHAEIMRRLNEKVDPQGENPQSAPTE